MQRRSFLKLIGAGLLLGGGALLLSGCFGIPKGTMKDATVGTVKLQAAGAGIVNADVQKTTFRIKCQRCGYETGDIVIDTPAAGKPYIMDWKCPNCGHRQNIVIQVVTL